MARTWSSLVKKYERTLRAYLDGEGEEHLQQAYELGRAALNRGLGVLEMVRLHQAALVKIIVSQKSPTALIQPGPPGETLLLEALTPFEAAHRGFRDTSARFGLLNETLKQRNKELAASIKKLGEEVVSRTQVQQQLAEAQRLAHLGSFELDLRTGKMKWSDELYRIYGLMPRKYKPSFAGVLALVHPEDRERTKRSIADAIRSRRSFVLERRIIRPNKKIRTLHTQGEVIGGGKGEPLRLVGFSQDITERKQVEDALRESREHYFKLFQQAREMEENLRLLSHKVVSAQEEERKRISHELHEEIAQALTAVNVSIELFKKQTDPGGAFAKNAAVAQKLLGQSMEAVHHFARELLPSVLADLGPHAALRSYVKSFSERTGIKAILQIGVNLRRLDGQQGIVLYRVTQESLTNVFKHAQATQVKIRIHRIPLGMCMEIKDNGRSFSVEKQRNGQTPTRRLGLLGMEERIRLINGKFSIASTRGHGTTVRVQIPFVARQKISGQKKAAHPTVPPLLAIAIQ